MINEEDSQVQDYISSKISESNAYQTTFNTQLAEERDQLDALILAKIQEIDNYIAIIDEYSTKVNNVSQLQNQDKLVLAGKQNATMSIKLQRFV
mgnify:CR=1 FL=1